MNPIQTLQDFDIPTHSYVHAIQMLNERGKLSPIEYRERIKGLTEVECTIDDQRVRYVYLYLVQETIRTSYNTDKFNMMDLLGLAVRKADTFINKNKWMFVTPIQTTVKLDAAGNPKQKKGAKKTLAIQVYKENKHRDLKRKEWIELLVEKVGLTPAGASTYYASLKKGTWS